MDGKVGKKVGREYHPVLKAMPGKVMAGQRS